jgi:ubiquinone/menaquinone biosynthesis C-methylase UbiE
MKRLILLLSVSSAAWTQVADKANAGYRTPEGRERVAKTLSSPDRESRVQPNRIIEAVPISRGMTVVDLGTGVGFMLPYLSAAVGPSGKVLAQDIFPDFLERAKATAERKKLSNVEFIFGSDRHPKLPDGAADAVLILDAYHHFDYPADMLAGIRRGLKKSGRLVVVDFYKNGFRDPEHIRIDEAEVIKEVEGNGFRLVSQKVHEPKSQYMLLFEPK